MTQIAAGLVLALVVLASAAVAFVAARSTMADFESGFGVPPEGYRIVIVVGAVAVVIFGLAVMGLWFVIHA